MRCNVNLYNQQKTQNDGEWLHNTHKDHKWLQNNNFVVQTQAQHSTNFEPFAQPSNQCTSHFLCEMVSLRNISKTSENNE